MRKNRAIAALTIAAAVMMTVTACGSKKTAETASAAADMTAETTAEVTAADTTAEKTTQETTIPETTITQASTEETTETATEETTAPAVGDVKKDGSFAPSNGRYSVTPPAGWSVDEASDDQYATFMPENGDDMLELVFLTGDESSSMVEILPPTAEEYKELVSRDGGMDIVKYDVTTKDNGSQTFQYAMRYNDPSDGIRYIAMSGIYDVAKKEYIAATGTVVSDSEDVIKAVQAAVDSFQVK